MKLSKSISAEELISGKCKEFPNTVKAWFFGGIRPDKIVLPDITPSLKLVDKYLSIIKNDPEVRNGEPIMVSTGPISLKSTLTNNLDFLLSAVSVLVVTEQDENTTAQVKNIFTGCEESILIPPSNENEFDSKADVLGKYLPATGTIILYLHKIFENDYPFLNFQHTLLHEFIHALFDVNSRRIVNGTKSTVLKNEKFYKPQDEECLDNVLVLYIYDHACVDNRLVYNLICKAISQEPQAYKKALGEYESVFMGDTYKIFTAVKELLKKKIQWDHTQK